MENPYETVRRLMIATNKINGIYYLCARKLGINENALSLLYALDDGNPHSQKQICAEWLIPKTTINTIVKELVAAGYIALVGGAHTKEKTICLTERGSAYTEQILKSIYAAEQQAIQQTVQAFSPAFADAFDFFADRLCDAFQPLLLTEPTERKPS